MVLLLPPLYNGETEARDIEQFNHIQQVRGGPEIATAHAFTYYAVLNALIFLFFHYLGLDNLGKVWCLNTQILC